VRTGELPCSFAFRLLVALLPRRDLLLFAKHLFAAARGGGGRQSSRDGLGAPIAVLIFVGQPMMRRR
jgi:hypothetical protein